MNIGVCVIKRLGLAAAFATILLCVGCGGKFHNPIVSLEAAPTAVVNDFYSQVKNEQTLLQGEKVYSVVISNDSRYVAIHTYFNEDKILDPKNGWQLVLDEGVSFEDFSPNGENIVVTTDSSIRIMALHSRVLVREWAGLESPKRVSYSPDGKMLAYSTDKSVQVVDTEDGKLLFDRALDDSVAIFSPNNKQLAVVTNKNASGRPFEYITGTIWLLDATVGIFDDDALRLYDLASGRTVFEQVATDSVVRSAQFSKDGRFMAVGVLKDWDSVGGGEIQLLDTSDGKKVYSWPTSQYMNGLALSPDGNLLTSSSFMHMSDLQTYNLATGREEHQLCSKERAGAMDVTYSPDGRFMAMALQAYPSGGQGAVVLYDTINKRVAYSSITNKTVYSVAFFPNGEFLAASGVEGIRLIPMAELNNEAEGE